MALILINNTKRYAGLSTDTRPTLTEADAGSEFFELDTETMYRWSGSAWGVTMIWGGQALAGYDRTNDIFAVPDIFTSVHGPISLKTVPGMQDCGVVHMHASAIAATSGFMLIDASNASGKWPHVAVGAGEHLHIAFLIVHIQPEATHVGDVHIGFIANEGAADSDVNMLMGWDFAKGDDAVNIPIEFGATTLDCDDTYWFGEVSANDPLFGTGDNIVGPDGANYNAGNGDLVMKITCTAKTVSVTLTVGYHKHI